MFKFIKTRGSHVSYTSWKIGEQCSSAQLFQKFLFFLCSLVHAKNIFNILTSALLWKMVCLCCCSCITFCSMLSSFGMWSHVLLSVVYLIALTLILHCAPLGRGCFFCSASKEIYSVSWEYGVSWLWKRLLIGREGREIGSKAFLCRKHEAEDRLDVSVFCILLCISASNLKCISMSYWCPLQHGMHG